MANASDAEIILKLYDLRREPEMRKARDTVFTEFWPESADDLLRITRSYGTDLNRYIRMVFGYWDMACSLVLHGALDEKLFFDCSHEMYPLFAKVRPFTKDFREATNSPEAFMNLEKLIMNSEQGRARLARVEEMLARFKELATKKRSEAA